MREKDLTYTNENALKDLRKKSRSVLTVQTESRGGNDPRCTA